MKKLLCISDQINPLIYSKNLKEKYGDIDLVISAGDLPMEYLDFIQSSLERPVLFVFGGHSLKALTHYHPEMSDKKTDASTKFKKNNKFKSEKADYIGFKARKIGELLIAGISGTKKQKDGKNEFSETQMRKKLFMLSFRLILNKLKYGRCLDILVSHTPPVINDETPDFEKKGYKCFALFLKIFKPKYMLHGSIHLHTDSKSRFFDFNKTRIINVYDKYILEVE